MAFGLGSGGSRSKSFLAPQQEGYLKELWGWGSGLMGDLMAGGPQNAFGLSRDLLGARQQIGQGLFNNPFRQALLQQATNPWDTVSSGANVLSDQISQFTDRQMAQAEQTGVQAGQFGNRTNVAKSLIAESGQDAFRAGLTDLWNRQADRSLQAQTTGYGLNTQAGLGLMDQQLNTFSLGMAPFTSAGAFAPLYAQQGLLGNPVVLGKGKQSSFNVSG